MSPAVELEVRSSRTAAYDLAAGEWMPAIKVAYRPAGERWWRRFVLTPKAGQPLDELERRVELIAQLVHAGKADLEPAGAFVDVDEIPDDGAA